jgi:hypothetical protein
VPAYGCGYPSSTSTATVSITIGGYGAVSASSVTAADTPGCYNVVFVLPSLATSNYTVSITSGGVTESGLLMVNTGAVSLREELVLLAPVGEALPPVDWLDAVAFARLRGRTGAAGCLC